MSPAIDPLMSPVSATFFYEKKIKKNNNVVCIIQITILL